METQNRNGRKGKVGKKNNYRASFVKDSINKNQLENEKNESD